MASALLRVNGGAVPVETLSDLNGEYIANIPLLPNRINRLFITEIDSNRIIKTFAITQNSEPPSVFIDFPEHQSTQTNSSIIVAGRVGDMLNVVKLRDRLICKCKLEFFSIFFPLKASI